MNQAHIIRKIWKSKIPAKIKVFLWLMMNNATLTKDNLLKRKWSGDPSCYFCDNDENISHLFFQCSTAKTVWAIVARSIGADNIPRSLSQCWAWCEHWLPNGSSFIPLGSQLYARPFGKHAIKLVLRTN